MSHSLQNSFLSAFGAIVTATLFVGASIMPAFNHVSSLVI
jgi:hypothetical protein